MLRVFKHSRILYKFSNSNIPFQFDLPANPSTLKIVQNSNEVTETKVKTFKAKRKGLTSELIPKQRVYDSQSEIASRTQKIYQTQFEESLKQGNKTRNYYDYEFSRGQDLIDDMPVNPYYQYKQADFQKQVQDRKIQFETFKSGASLKKSLNVQYFKNIVEGYENAKHRYELQQFKQYLTKYPGSLKGPHPQDDPYNYFQYARKKMPAFIQAEIIKQDKYINSYNNQSTNISAGFLSDMIGQDRKEIPEIQNIQQHLINDLKDNIPILSSYSSVPHIPNINYQQYHSYIAKIQLWWKFSQTYRSINEQTNFELLMNALHSANEQILRRHGGSYTLRPKISSLYIYYRTLPKIIRENPQVRTVYLGLQYSCPDYTYQQKEQALNMAAYMSLPLDKVSHRMIDDVTKKKKFYLTPHLVDRINNIHPQYTWDIHDFLQQVKEEKMRSMSTVKQKQTSFVEPEHYWKRTEQDLANLPVDFYDNDDGFWDQHIEQKLNYNYQTQPLSKKDKKYFIH